MQTGVPWTPLRKSLFHQNFVTISTPYTKYNYNNNKIFVPFQDGRQMTNFNYNLSILAKKIIWKHTFPKEIWLKIGDHEYVNIAEISFKNFVFRCNLNGRKIVCTPKMIIMLISAKKTLPIYFLFHQRSATTILGNYKRLQTRNVGTLKHNG